jgi:hypothetical protein
MNINSYICGEMVITSVIMSPQNYGFFDVFEPLLSIIFHFKSRFAWKN